MKRKVVDYYKTIEKIDKMLDDHKYWSNDISAASAMEEIKELLRMDVEEIDDGEGV